MPLFEYLCRDCGRHFEELVSGGRAPSCPGCASARVDKQLSVFATGNGRREREAPAGGCGRCGDPRGPGSCQLS
jgi:putative FmdB family regulatory protein